MPSCLNHLANLFPLSLSRPNALSRRFALLTAVNPQLRVAQRNSGSQSKLARIGTVRKSIARVLTVFNQVSREKLKEKYTSQGTGLPKEYREKKTRAIRRKLTKEQATKKTAKGAKKASNFPMRKFAIRS